MKIGDIVVLLLWIILWAISFIAGFTMHKIPVILTIVIILLTVIYVMISSIIGRKKK